MTQQSPSPTLPDIEEAPVPLGASTSEPPREERRVASVPSPPAREDAFPSANDFTSERMLRPQSEAPRMGGRVRCSSSVAGSSLGPGAAELRDRELIARVKASVAGCRRIAVVSRKGGVGKTTTTLMLGHTFASYRGDRVIALDGIPDAGSLGYRVRRETTNTIMSLLAHRDEIARYADIRAYTSQAPPAWRSWRPTTTRGSRTPCASRTSPTRSSCSRSNTTSSAWTPAQACWSRRPRAFCGWRTSSSS